ncbi:glycosyltransferase [Peterkaempfera bronchialis]|uniref:glycosyltransferase n=1 Tax=Peterkaempfera bronchialis TaxID=2126346 RepID=UPI003C2DCD84
MRIALLTESADPGTVRWCERLVRSLPEYAFQQHVGPGPRRPHPRRGPRGRARVRCLRSYEALVRALVDPRESDGFPAALYALAESAGDRGLAAALPAPDDAQRVLERAWRSPGAGEAAADPTVRDVLTAADLLDRCLRPAAVPWCRDATDPPDLCHVVDGGPTALPALLARRLHGTPFVVSDRRLHLREQYLDRTAGQHRTPGRALLLTFLRLLAQETGRQAALTLPAGEHSLRWQQRCGADPARTRLVRDGIADPGHPAAGPEPEAPTLLWVRTPGDTCPPEALRAAFARVREQVPAAQLRMYDAEPTDPPGPGLVYGEGSVVLLPAPALPRPEPLVAAMLSGRAVIAGDLGVAREVVGPAGLLIPPGDPQALADACTALLCDPERRARLGTAGRQRAQELYSAEAAADAFRTAYLDAVSRWPAFPTAGGRTAEPFARPAEYWAAAPLPERETA